MIRIFFCVLVVMFLTACNNRSEKRHFQKSYSLKIVDSVRVDYLGNFYLFDYSPEREVYLARGHGDREFLFFDAEGNIVDSVRLKMDGPDAIAGVQAVGFVDGHLSIFESVKGLLVFGDGGKLDKRHEIPRDYFCLNGYNGKPFFALREELAYYRPERGEVQWDNFGEIMKSVYQNPILEVLNPKTGDIRHTMAFPSTSKFKDGEYHGWTFPTVVKQGDVWLLYFASEYQFYIYREKEGGLKLQQTVKMNVPDAISAEGVPFDQADRFEEVNRLIMRGRLSEVFFYGDKILAVYSKGMDEEETSLYDFETLEGRMEAYRATERFVQVFDLKGNVLADIPCPKGMLLVDVVNGNGQWVMTKDQAYFGQEEDWQTVYMLELVSK